MSLRRVINLPFLIFYGVGAILGAGVYVLIGKVVGYAGVYAPLAFLISAILASLTGLSYSELASRIPKSAGEVAYVERAFKNQRISQWVGYIVIFTGVFSAATLSKGFFGYFQVFFQAPEILVVATLIFLLGLFACWGIKESMFLVTLITLIEIGGLIMVIVISGENLTKLPDLYPTSMSQGGLSVWSGILLGAFLAFYAFIGFEDMVNVAEEVIDPEKTIPRAIILSVLISTVLYILVSLVTISSMPIDLIAHSKAPLADIVSRKGKFYVNLVSLISLIAVINGALIQIIMASRVLYGMSEQGLTHTSFKNLNSQTGTPIKATLFISGAILFFCIALPLTSLGEITSFVIILLFMAINLSLIQIKRSEPKTKNFKVPIVIPVLGTLLSLIFLIVKIFLVIG